MANYSSKDHFYVSVKRPLAEPISLEIQVKKIQTLIGIVLGVIAFMALGTLLFFRELEINRKLKESLLDLQTRHLLKTFSETRTLPPMVTTPRYTAEKPAQPITPAPVTETVSPVETVDAKVLESNLSCTEAVCEIQLAMVPTATGTASGKLLVALESEIQRIGTPNPQQAARTHYSFYPENDSVDDLSETTLAKLEKKPFHFSKALRTTAQFVVDAALKPTLFHIYLYDEKNVLVEHIRKPITLENENAN